MTLKPFRKWIYVFDMTMKNEIFNFDDPFVGDSVCFSVSSRSQEPYYGKIADLKRHEVFQKNAPKALLIVSFFQKII